MMVSSTCWEKDGPYSWVVLVMIVLSRFIGIGFAVATSGVLADEYPRLFNTEQAKTNVIGSTLLCVFLFTVPINTLLMKVIGVRKMSIIGTALILIGIVPSAFATQIWHLVISYSIVTCLGMSMSTAATLGIVRHYFDKRKGAAFAGIGLGAGIGQVVFPYILSSMLAAFGYKYAILYLSPVFLLNILPPVLFKEQLPLNKPKSMKHLLKSYAKSFKHYVTPFFLLNAFFARGAQLAVLVLLFSHIANDVDNQTAVISYSVIGFSFLSSTLVLTLVMLKVKLNTYIMQIIFNTAIGVSVCIMASFHLPLVYYISCGVLGFAHGGTLAIKGALSVHVYPADATEYSYGLSEAIGGIGSFLFPLAGGYIQQSYGSASGLYFLGATEALGGAWFIVAGAIRSAMWRPYERTAPDERTTPEKQDEEKGEDNTAVDADADNKFGEKSNDQS